MVFHVNASIGTLVAVGYFWTYILDLFRLTIVLSSTWKTPSKTTSMKSRAVMTLWDRSTLVLEAITAAKGLYVMSSLRFTKKLFLGCAGKTKLAAFNAAW